MTRIESSKRRYLSWHFSYRVAGKQHVGTVHYGAGHAITAAQCKSELIYFDGLTEPISVWPMRRRNAN